MTYTGLWETFYCNKEDGTADNSIECIRGFLLKRRKFPLKGFHKVPTHLYSDYLYYIFSRGTLCYKMDSFFMVDLKGR